MLSCVLKAFEEIEEKMPDVTELGDRQNAQQVRQLIQTFSPLTFAIFSVGNHNNDRRAIWT
jgi:hypothetical protein